MRSDLRFAVPLKQVLAVLFATTALTALGSCGKLGKKLEPDDVIHYQTEANECVDGFKKQIDLYANGQADMAKWGAAWDCLIKEVRDFPNRVKPGTKAGYTVENILTFANQFLVKETPLTNGMVTGIFEFKAFMVGGSPDILTVAEIGRFATALESVKDVSTRFFPKLATWHAKEDRKSIADMADGLETAVMELGAAVEPGLTAFYPFASLESLVGEFTKKAPTDQLTLIAKLKTIVLGGMPDGLEGELWPHLVRLASRGAAVGFTFARMPQESMVSNAPQRDYFLKAWGRIERILLDVVDWNGGKIPLTSVDELMAALPADFFPIPRDVIGRALRPIVHKILGASAPNVIEGRSIQKITRLLTDFHVTLTAIEQIYAEAKLNPSGVSLAELVQAALRHLDRAPNDSEKAATEKVLYLARHYRPLYVQDDMQISFSGAKRYSLHHMMNILWARTLAEVFVEAYGTDPKANGVTLSDVEALIGDIMELGTAFKLMDPAIPNTAKRHFVNMNLFTPASDGDGLAANGVASVDELTYYIPMLISAKTLSARMRPMLAPLCSTPSIDPLGWNWMETPCVRRELVAHHEQIWDHFPELVRTFQSLKARDQRTLISNFEQAARRYGLTDLPIGGYDTDALAMIVHYGESLFSRFDKDGNQVLDVTEVIDAFPIFRDILAMRAEVDPNDPKQQGILIAALTYTAKYGKPPNKKNIWELLHFVGWLIAKPTWKISSGREVLFKIIAAISQPEALPTDGNTGDNVCPTERDLDDSGTRAPACYQLPEFRDVDGL